jgi:WD40 repeat protein
MRGAWLTLGAGLVLAAGAAFADEKRPLLIVSNRTGNADIFLIDPVTGDARNLTNHPASDTWPAWSPDGARVVFTSDRDGTDNLYVMDADGGHLRPLTHEKAGTTCRAAAWSPDGSQIAFSRLVGDSAQLRVVNSDGTAEKTLARDAGHPTWSPDGKRLAFISTAPAARPQHLCVVGADGGDVRELDAGPCLFPAWSPDGKRIAYSAVTSGPLELFVIDADGANRRQLAHLGYMNVWPAWAPDGRSLTVVHHEPPNNRAVYLQINLDGTRLEVSPLSGPQCKEIPANAGRPAWKPAPTATTPPPAAAAVPGPGKRHVSVLNRLSGWPAPLNHAVYSPDGKTLAVAGFVGEVSIWERDGTAWRHLGLAQGHKGPVWGLAFSPDGKSLASASADQTVRVWDVARRAERFALDDHKARVSSVAFSPDGKTLVTGAADRSVKVRVAADGKVRHAVELPGEATWCVAALAISPDGKTLVAGGGAWEGANDGSAAAWDVESGRQLWAVRGEFGGAWGVAFAPDGRTLALGCLDATVRLLDPATGKERSSLKGHPDRVMTVAFMPDGKTLASSGCDNTIRLWDVATGRQDDLLAGHWLSVQRFSISPDGREMASAGADCQVLFWQLEAPRPAPEDRRE